MARRAGRNGTIYFEITSGGSAEPIAYQSRWSINSKTNKIDVTAFLDTNKTYVAGLRDASGMFSGFYDDATAQTFTAATDGIARKFYLYPDRVNKPAQYWFSTILADFSVDGDVDGAITVSADWNAASDLLKVG